MASTFSIHICFFQESNLDRAWHDLEHENLKVQLKEKPRLFCLQTVAASVLLAALCLSDFDVRIVSF